MKRTYLGLSLLIIANMSVFAQAEFLPGKVMFNDGIEISGYINNKGDMSLSKSCFFKESLDQEAVHYTPNDIHGYFIANGKYYISKFYEGQVNFMEFLIDGIVDIFYYRNATGKDLYFIEKNNDLLPLTQKEQEVIKQGRTFRQTKEEYKGILKYLFFDGPNTFAQIDNISLDHQSLIDIAESYHNETCTDGSECIVYAKMVPKIQLDFGVIANIGKYNPIAIDRVTNEEFYYLNNPEIRSSLSPELGLFLDLSFEMINTRLHLIFQSSISKINLRFTNDYYGLLFGDRYHNEIKWNRLMSKNIFLLRYIPPEKKINPFFEIGPFILFGISSDFERVLTITRQNENEPFFMNSGNDNPFDNTDLGLTAGGGLRINTEKLTAELFGHYGRGARVFEGYKSNSFSAGIRYIIQ